MREQTIDIWTAERHAAEAEALLLSSSTSLERSVTALVHIHLANYKAAQAAMELTRGVMERQERRTEELLSEAAPSRAPDGTPWYAHLDGPCGPECQRPAVSVEETGQ